MCARALRKGVLRVRCCHAVASLPLYNSAELSGHFRECAFARGGADRWQHRYPAIEIEMACCCAAAAIRHTLTVSRGESEMDERLAKEIVPPRAEPTIVVLLARRENPRICLNTGSCPIIRMPILVALSNEIKCESTFAKHGSEKT